MNSEIRLFVGNLPENTTKKDLEIAFSSYGNITNLDLKSKPGDNENKKNFAFITLETSNSVVESCINHFSLHTYKGNKLYVTRARESFLERLERERKEQKEKAIKKDGIVKQPIHPILHLGDRLNPRKKKLSESENSKKGEITFKSESRKGEIKNKIKPSGDSVVYNEKFQLDRKKQDADKKRMESIRKKRQEFKEKQNIIKVGLHGIDKIQNKKVIFSDDEPPKSKSSKNNDGIIKNRKPPVSVKPSLFDEIDDSGDEVNFDIKKQYEGKKGQKVLDLQSRYKTDKRFTLDERFLDDQEDETEDAQDVEVNNESIEMGPADEKAKQLNILEDVLGVTLRKPISETADKNKKNKTKFGMLRFDPTQPEHAKFLAPVEQKQENMKKGKKKKKDKEVETEENKQEIKPELPKPEVSKEQFYKVSETLKEAIVQPTSFSLRSLFGNKIEESKAEEMDQDTDYTTVDIHKEQKKIKNPLDPGEKNPFRYDSSESEDDEKEEMQQEPLPKTSQVKAVWKENLFFGKLDQRLKDGLTFFNKTGEGDTQKERRELKFLMKKRIYNKERKNQMFQKKIGGRKKSLKKSYNRKTNYIKK